MDLNDTVPTTKKNNFTKVYTYFNQGKSIPGTSRDSSTEASSEPPSKRKKISDAQHLQLAIKMDDNLDSDSEDGFGSDNDYKLQPVQSIKEEQPGMTCPTLFTFLSLSELPTQNSPKSSESADSEPGTDPLTTTPFECKYIPSLNIFDINSAGNEELKIKPESSSPIHYFSLLFTRQFFQQIVDETNKFARLPSSQISHWKDLTTDEIKVFLGLFFHTGVIKIMRLRYYWDKSELFNFPFFSNRMSRDRFLSILQSLRFTEDPVEAEAAPKDPLYQIRSIIQHFHNRMTEVYESRKKINTDDSMMTWKGRVFYRSYVPNKIYKYGIKLYILAENDGLIHRLLIHPGTEDSDLESQGDAGRVAQAMLESMENAQPSPFMDNLYNGVAFSPEMLQELAGKGNSSHVNISKTATKRGGEQGRPKGVLQFNKRIGAIDQLLSYYLNTRKSLKWYTKLCFDILELMLLNSYLLYKRYSEQKDRCLFNFRLDIVKNLSGPGMPKVCPVRTPSTLSFINSVHFPTTDPDCPAKKKRRAQKRCRLCYEKKIMKSVITFCPGCEGNPGLCLSCFVEYHRKNDFKII
uniref:piggyBac transposable element-derived protein 4-like isoform X2 n=1 Tax=Osmia lignaria TaxID=473952 RepID=UPI001478E9DD|nr:piggyBac transposable element-derived protein 4-like isoform X2 [Osmia lignaria]